MESSEKIIGPPQEQSSTKFSSEEDYTPVYDKQLSDLQLLTSAVVNSVTAFYTYRKTMMDCLRSVSLAGDKQEAQERFEQMIYKQFLMYESARYAIRELSEFQPDRAESLVNILCSELALFSFLFMKHPADYKGDRLRLRVPEYHKQVQELLEQIHERESESAWAKAKATSEQLYIRYRECEPLWTKPHVVADKAAD